MSTRIEILTILSHYFKLGLQDTETAHIVWEIKGNETNMSICKTSLSVLRVVTYPLK